VQGVLFTDYATDLDSGETGSLWGDLPPYEAFPLGGANSVRGDAEGGVHQGWCCAGSASRECACVSAVPVRELTKFEPSPAVITEPPPQTPDVNHTQRLRLRRRHPCGLPAGPAAA